MGPIIALPFRQLFTKPGADRFIELLMAWVLGPGRRTGTRLWQMITGADRPRYEAYVAFCREGRWPQQSDLMRVWAHLLLHHLVVRQMRGLRELWLLLDDTLFHKSENVHSLKKWRNYRGLQDFDGTLA